MKLNKKDMLLNDDPQVAKFWLQSNFETIANDHTHPWAGYTLQQMVDATNNIRSVFAIPSI